MAAHAPHMIAVKARFDGQRIVLPNDLAGVPPGNVIVIFEDADDAQDRALWLKAQEEAFAKAWDNPEDAVYDQM
jgi:hypothetical protein